MKKAIRSLLAVTLAACVVLPLASCSKKTKKTEKNTNIEDSDLSDERAEITDDRSDKGDTKGASGKNTPKTLKANPKRTVENSTSYYNAEKAELKLAPVQGVEFATTEFTASSIVGDRILANVRVTLKDKEKMMNTLLANDYLMLDEEIFYSLQLFDLNGENIATIPMGDRCDFLRAFPMNNGEILVTTAEFNPNDCKTKPKFFVISPSGEKLRDIEFENTGALYSLQAYPVDNGNFFISSEGVLFLFDSEGKLIKKQKDQSLGCYMNYSDGKWYVARNMPPTNYIGAYQEVDVNTGELLKTYKVEEGTAAELAKNKDCLLFSNTGVSQYHIEEGKATPILSNTSADVNCAHLTNGELLPDGSMTFINVDADNDNDQYGTACYCHYANTMSVVKLTPADKNPNAGKEILKLGLYLDTDPYLVEKIQEYNADPSSNAYIEVYTIRDNDLSGNPDDILIQFMGLSAQQVKEDLYNGTGPDLLVGFSNLAELNTDEYLVDLKQYLDNDATIKKEDYFNNIFDAFSTNGKMYSLPLTYSLHGMVINTTDTEVKEKWTFADMDKAKSSLLPEKRIIPPYTCAEMLLPIMTATCSDFVDYEKGEANFNSDEFKSLLEAIKKETVTDTKYEDGIIFSDGHFLSPDIQFNTNSTIAIKANYASLDDYCTINADPARKTLSTGYPSLQGKGMTARGELSMSITACASNPDLAWEFIRYFLNSETQDYLSTNKKTLPVNRNAFDTNCQAQIDLSTQLYKDYSKNPAEFGAEPVRITDEKKAEFANVISSVDNAYRLDSEILKIVLEEADRYFHDFQSLDFIAKTIQERATEVLKNR